MEKKKTAAWDTYEILSKRKAKRGHTEQKKVLLANFRLAEMRVKRTALEYGASYLLDEAIKRRKHIEETFMQITTE